MKARNIVLTITLAVLVAAPLVIVAQTPQGNGPGSGQGGPHRGGGHSGSFGGGQGLGFFDRMLPRVAEQIGLSEEQVEQIQGVVDEIRPTMESYLEELRAGREEYRALNNDPTVFDEGAFRAHADTQHEIQTNLRVVVEKTKAEVFGILTPEQREELEEMRADMGQRFKRRSSGRRAQ